MIDLCKKLERSHHFWIALSALVVFFLFRLPSLFEPYWYGDEGIYETLGLGITRGRILYTQIWDNKPPLLYYTYALVGGNQFLVRLLSLLAGAFALTCFYFLCRKLFKTKASVIAALSTFVLLFGLPIIEGNIANAENFMLFPIILAGLLICTSIQKQPKPLTFLGAGLLLGIAFLYKIVGVFDFAAFFIFSVVSLLPPRFTKADIITFIKEYWKLFGLLLIGFIIPFTLSILYFLGKGALGAYIQAIFLSTVGYVGYKNAFIIPQGLLLSKLFLLGGFVLILFIKRKSLSMPQLFILLWIAFSLFNSFFSQRPYTHYLLVLVPSFSLIVGSIFTEKKQVRIASAALALGLILLVLEFFNHWSLKKTIGYYGNFISFITNHKSVNDYTSFFDRRATRDEEIARYILAHAKGDPTVFVWGNSAEIYYLTKSLPPNRFTVRYHISGVKKYEEEAALALKPHEPQFIVVMRDGPPYPYPMYNYRHVLFIQEADIYERTY